MQKLVNAKGADIQSLITVVVTDLVFLNNTKRPNRNDLTFSFNGPDCIAEPILFREVFWLYFNYLVLRVFFLSFRNLLLLFPFRYCIDEDSCRVSCERKAIEVIGLGTIIYVQLWQLLENKVISAAITTNLPIVKLLVWEGELAREVDSHGHIVWHRHRDNLPPEEQLISIS